MHPRLSIRNVRGGRRALTSIALALGLGACAPDRLAHDLDGWTGRMTQAQAERRFGPPTHVMTVGGQSVWSYEESAVVGVLPTPESPAEAPGPFVGRTVRRQLLLYFDARGVLTHWDRY